MVVLNAKQPILTPANHFTDPRINTASVVVFDKAARTCHSQNRLHLGCAVIFLADAIVTDCDRHHYIVEQVPYSECEGEFEEGNKLMSNFKFYVYGQVAVRVLSHEISLRCLTGSETALQRC